MTNLDVLLKNVWNETKKGVVLGKKILLEDTQGQTLMRGLMSITFLGAVLERRWFNRNTRML